MGVWQTIVFLWNWFNVFLTIASLAFSVLALYRQYQGTDVVDTAASFAIVPLGFETVKSPPLSGHKACTIVFKEMTSLEDVGSCFLPLEKDLPTNFSVAVETAASNLLDKQVFIQLTNGSMFPVNPGQTSTTGKSTVLKDIEHMDLMLVWKDSPVMDGIVDGSVSFKSVFPQMNMSLLCFA